MEEAEKPGKNSTRGKPRFDDEILASREFPRGPSYLASSDAYIFSTLYGCHDRQRREGFQLAGKSYRTGSGRVPLIFLRGRNSLVPFEKALKSAIRG